MFGSIGMPELIIIFIIALVIFGPRRLPELGRALGQSIAEFRRSTSQLRSTLDDEIHADEERTRRSSEAAPHRTPAPPEER